MSKPRYKWWSYVKGVIREYPALKDKYNDLHSTNMIAQYESTGGGRSCDISDPTGQTAIRELPKQEQREYEAVRMAISTTERYKNGRDRLIVINMVLWKKSHTLDGAALYVPCDLRTAKQWHGDFIRQTAMYLGLMD